MNRRAAEPDVNWHLWLSREIILVAGAELYEPDCQPPRQLARDFFLDMAVRYATLPAIPMTLPSGYAALLCLCGLR